MVESNIATCVCIPCTVERAARAWEELQEYGAAACEPELQDWRSPAAAAEKSKH